MPSWSEVLAEIQGERIEHAIDLVRRRYLAKLADYTKRDTICYYSGWLDGANSPEIIINDNDKNAFMAAVQGLKRDRGLDLLLHTPGGDVGATESIVHYLREMFGTDIRAVVPQIAMSAGTMVAFACKQIIMGKQSNLGPIDPHLGGMPAAGILAEFRTAIDMVKKEPESAAIWHAIIGKYHPTLLEKCEKVIEWSQKMTVEWLASGMFNDAEDSFGKATEVVTRLSDGGEQLNHARHIHMQPLKDLDLDIVALEDDDDLQDLVLTVHHAYCHTLSSSGAHKIVENHLGVATIRFYRSLVDSQTA